jgi:trans-aconitate 2-methyltransferase
MVHAWNPADYHQHSSAQQTWARELIEKLRLGGNERVLDLGCGEGKVTADIAARLRGGEVLGLDISPAMVSFAREHYPKELYPNLLFTVGDMLNLQFEREFDVVFSNAALHWVSDHGRVFSGIRRALRPGGRVLLQMGGKGNAAPVLAIVDEMRTEEPWSEHFRGFSFSYAFYGPEEERRSLEEAGIAPVRVELIRKDLAFDSEEGLAGWIRTTWLVYLEQLPDEMRPIFIREIVGRYQADHPSPDGKIHIPMMRLEVEGVSRT